MLRPILTGRRGGPAVAFVLAIAVLAMVPAISSKQLKSFPAHWGDRPSKLTRDLVEWPSGYGKGSGSIKRWIEKNLAKDAKKQGRFRQKTKVPPSTKNRWSELETEEFDSTVVEKNKNFYFVFFHHARCVHCQTLMPEFKLASFGGMMPGIGELVKFVIVDVTAEDEFTKKHKIVSYPTLRFYGPEYRTNPRQLDGWRSNTIEKNIQIQEWLKAMFHEMYPDVMKQLRPAAELMDEKTKPGFEDDDADELSAFEKSTPKLKNPIRRRARKLEQREFGDAQEEEEDDDDDDDDDGDEDDGEDDEDEDEDDDDEEGEWEEGDNDDEDEDIIVTNVVDEKDEL